MKLAVVCEAPPTTDPLVGDGSTLISSHLLARLPDAWEVRIAYFVDGPTPAVGAVGERSARPIALPLRSRRLSFLADTVTPLPRATWRRNTGQARRVAADLSGWADVTYLHGLHTFGLARHVRSPLVVHEVDPWSDHWAQRSAGGGLGAHYDLRQAGKAQRLERQVAGLARRYILVSPSDAGRCSTRWQRPVDALPNGCAMADRPPAPVDVARPATIAFVGSLDYGPNVGAAHELVTELAPRIRRSVADLRVVLAGRAPVERIIRLAGDGVEVHADVADMRDEIAAASVIVLPGSSGFGVRNAVLESICVGRPVVATPSSARGVDPGPHLIVRSTVPDLADEVVALLQDRGRWENACRSSAAAATQIATWDVTASRFVDLLTDAGAGRAAR